MEETPEKAPPSPTFAADGMSAAQAGRKMSISAEQDKTAAFPVQSPARSVSSLDRITRKHWFRFFVGFAGRFPDLNELDGAGAIDHARIPQIPDRRIREAAIAFRRCNSEKVEVRISPDSTTEISVEFARRNGQVEASLQVQRGDAQVLRQNWSELQRLLKEQGVHLLDFAAGFGGGFHGGSDNQRRYTAPLELAETGIAFTPPTARQTERSARFSTRSQHRLLESWA